MLCSIILRKVDLASDPNRFWMRVISVQSLAIDGQLRLRITGFSRSVLFEKYTLIYALAIAQWIILHAG